MITTNDGKLAERCQLIRNHAEAVVERKGVSNLTNMIGFNYRMGEIEAAIGKCQLNKAPALIKARQENVQYLNALLSNIPVNGAGTCIVLTTTSLYSKMIKWK